MPTFTYTVPDFIPFTKIKSADVNSRFQDIADFLNGQIGNSNIADNSINRNQKLSIGTANAVVINDNTGKMSEEAQLATSRGGLGFAPTVSAGTAGQVLAVNNAGNSFELASPTAGTLIEQLAGSVPGIVAGESISANDAVSLILNNGLYKVVKCQATDGTRSGNYWGFATNSATVTPQITTLTKNSSWTTGSISVTINNRVYTQVFTSNNDTSMSDLATLIAADPDVQSAAGSGSPVDTITITSKGGLSLVISSSSSGGAPSLTVTNTQTSAGDSVRVQMFGPLDGFSGMNASDIQYTSSVIGGITAAPGAGAVKVGQALSSTVLFIFPPGLNITFGSSKVYIRAVGTTSLGVSGSQVATVEHFSGAAWSLGTASPVLRRRCGNSDATALNLMWLIDGLDGGGTATATTYSYNKAAWTSNSSHRGATLYEHTLVGFNNFLYANNGFDGTSYYDRADKFNGTSWATPANWADAQSFRGGFVIGATQYMVFGHNGGGYSQDTETRSTADSVGSGAAGPVLAAGPSASMAPNGLGIVTSASQVVATTDSYSFNGASWSTAIASTYAQEYEGSNGQGFGTSGAYALSNGGYNGSAMVSTAQKFDGISYSATASSAASVGEGITGSA